jgi:hypothetical protein
MIPKHYIYKDIDGMHWPDAPKGNAEYYSINFEEYLACELDALVGVEWEVPEEISSEDPHLEGGEAFIKLIANSRGSHKILCKVDMIEFEKTQTKVIPMVLKVY